MNRICICVVFVIGFCATSNLSGQSFLKADGGNIVNGEGDKVILRGVGLGGWMLQEGYMLRVENIGSQQHKIRAKIEELVGPEKTQEFYDAWLANHTRKIDIDSMARWGFNSVRLPIHYNLYTLPVDQEPVKGQNTWLEKGFAMTDELLKWCAANHLYLILDLHATPGGQGNDVNISDRDDTKPSLWQSEANQQKTIALWRKLAERYANEPWIGAYDIINEPNWGFEKADDSHGCSESKNEPLKRLMMQLTKTIREVDQKHIIIVEGNCWGNNYNGIFPLWDPNMVVSFHKYWNNNDQASIQKFIDIRTQYKVPVWLGESGENSNVWFADAIRLMEDHDIGWCWWPLKKLGFNNPLQIKQPDGYAKILEFWKGKGPEPSSAEAYKGLMELASNTKLENCIYHKDVIDAMFRQVRSTTAKPFVTGEFKNELTRNAVDYDLGRNGVAYMDKDTGDYHISSGGDWKAWNRGRVYRNDGVDIAVDKEGGYYVEMEEGEWLQYTMHATQAGTYQVVLKASASGASEVSVKLGSQTQTLSIVKTAQDWQLTKCKVEVPAGSQSIRIVASKGACNFKSMEFKKEK